MGKSNKSHGKKSDKETQSPVLKIFREMIQRERDPEKANLLKEKQEYRKRKQYFGSRSKSDHAARSCDSSSLRNKNHKYKHSEEYRVKDPVQDEERQYTQCRAQSISDKKDSWWFWADTQSQKPKADEDTCSCVSCALKQMVTSEYTCITCLALIFILTVVVAFYLVFRTVPIANNDVRPDIERKLDSEGLRKKIEMLNSKRVGVKEYAAYRGSYDERKDWDDTISAQLDELPSLSGTDYSERNLQGLNNLEGSSSKYSELSSVLDNEKVNDVRNSERLRDFYKKLIQTDAKIKKLRRDYTLNGDPGVKYDLDRSKRSIVNPLSLFQFKLNKGVESKAITDDEIYNLTYHNLFYPPLSAIKINKYKPKRYKRYRNITGEPTGFVIEKKKIFVQYKPDTPKRKIPKCSHVPKDSKSHESQMKHPFYKNTQRLDELLDKFLDRNLPEIMADPHGLDKLLKTNDNTDIDNSAKQRKLMKNKNIKFLSNASSAESNFEKDFYSNINNIGIEKPMSTTDSFSVALSVSTVVNPAYKKGTVPMKMSHVNPNLRKLMQINEEDEDSVLYEDFKEVLTDDMESHDETDRSANKKKRSNDNQFEESKSRYESIKTNPPGVHNPNWKGPLPLYPDELNTMIKQAAIENTNDKTNIPVDTYEETNSKLDLNDVQYVEDYVHNKYDKLAKMAQAYSDYGVLDEKKDSRNDNNQDKSMKNRVKLSIQKLKYFNNKLFNRLKKGTESEGIRVEVKPTSSSREDINQLGFVKKIQKHLKFTNDPDSVMQHQSFKPMDSQFVLFSTATPKAINLEDITTTNIYDEDRGAIQSMGKDKLEKKPFSNDKGNYFDNDNKYHYRKRSLKAVEIDNKPENDDDDNDVLENVNRSYEISNDWDTIVGFYRKRSLKFISDQNNTNMESNTVGDQNVTGINLQENIPGITIKNLNNISEIHTNNNTTTKINNTKNEVNEIDDTGFGQELSDFFKLISNWFSRLTGVSMNTNATISPNIINIKHNLNNAQKNASIDIVYPMYDTDMVDNIGHRSRVLMSANNELKNICKVENNEAEKQFLKTTVESDTSTSSLPNVIAITNDVKSLATIQKHNEVNTDDITKESKSNDNSTDKSVVKRSVPKDSNLIFWNDIYDDEYGIRLDPLEEKIADKRANKGTDFVKKSRQWLQDKVHKYFRGFKASPKNSKKNVSGANRNGNLAHSNNKVIKKRNAKHSDHDTNKPTDFAALTIKMKDVCKEAAKAVQETKNIKVREDGKEENVATSLMKELVRLMTDLVDFQVQEKTCLKLPADLQAFLEWLTSANSQETSKSAEYKLRLHDDLLDEDYLEKYDKTDHILDLATSNEKDIHIDPRSECLGTIHAIQTLMEQYNEMNDENKSKMTGVKQYLESQLEFLNKQLTLYDSLPNLYSNQAPIRFRRNVANNKQYDNHGRNKIKHRLNRKLRKYIKSFGIKHTKTTLSHFEAAQITEPSKVDKNNINNLVENENHITSERLNKKPVEFKKNELKHMNSESSNINIDNDEGKNKNNVDFKNVAKTDEVKTKLPNVYFKVLNEVKLDAHESGQKN